MANTQRELGRKNPFCIDSLLCSRCTRSSSLNLPLTRPPSTSCPSFPYQSVSYTTFPITPLSSASTSRSLIDLYEDLVSLPSTLPPTFDHYSTHIILQLQSLNAFTFLPSASLHPFSPPVLPDSTVAIVPEILPDTNTNGKAKMKTGRPSATDLQRRAVRAVSALDAWSTNNAFLSSEGTSGEAYESSKRHLAEVVSLEHIRASEQATLGKMKQLEEIFVRQGGHGTDDDGKTLAGGESMILLESAIRSPDGLLGLSKNSSGEGIGART